VTYRYRDAACYRNIPFDGSHEAQRRRSVYAPDAAGSTVHGVVCNTTAAFVPIDEPRPSLGEQR
jgi:hypothetical protein